MSNDALGSLAKTDVPGKLYDDLVHPTAQSIGKTASFIPRTVGVWLGRWECWIANGEESIKRAIDVAGEKAQAIPEEHLVEPPAYVAVPTIQQLAYSYDSEDLREMYANLLVSSMDDRTSEYVHPSFVQILKEMSPDEARLISSIARDMAEDPELVIPLIDLRVVPTGPMLPFRWRDLVRGYNVYCEGVCEHPDQSLVYLGNLERLGVIESSDSYPEDLASKFDDLESRGPIARAKVEASLPEGWKFDVRHWTYRVTNYGRNFIKTCTGVGAERSNPGEA